MCFIVVHIVLVDRVETHYLLNKEWIESMDVFAEFKNSPKF